MKAARLPSDTNVLEDYLLPMASYVDRLFATFIAYPPYFMDVSGGAASFRRYLQDVVGRDTYVKWAADLRRDRSEFAVVSSSFPRFHALKTWAALHHGEAKNKRVKGAGKKRKATDDTPLERWTNAAESCVRSIDNFLHCAYQFEKAAVTAKSTRRGSPLNKAFSECQDCFVEALQATAQLRTNFNSLLIWVANAPILVELVLNDQKKACVRCFGKEHPAPPRVITALRNLRDMGTIEDFHMPTLSDIHKLDARLKKCIYRSSPKNTHSDGNYADVSCKSLQVVDWIPSSKKAEAKKSSSKK